MDSKNNHDGSDNSEACVDNPALEEVIDTKPAALDDTDNYKDNDGEAEDISIKDKEKQYRMSRDILEHAHDVASIASQNSRAAALAKAARIETYDGHDNSSITNTDFSQSNNIGDEDGKDDDDAIFVQGSSKNSPGENSEGMINNNDLSKSLVERRMEQKQRNHLPAVLPGAVAAAAPTPNLQTSTVSSNAEDMTITEMKASLRTSRRPQQQENEQETKEIQDETNDSVIEIADPHPPVISEEKSEDGKEVVRMERDELNLLFNSTDEGNEMRPGSESVRGPGYTSERSFKMEKNESAMMLHAELVEEGIEDSERERIANAAKEELVSGAVKAEVVAVGDDEEQSKSNLLLFGVCIAIVVVVGVVVGVVIGTKENDSDSDETLNRDIPTNISAPTISPTSYLNRENFFSTTDQLYNAVDEYISGLRNASIDLEFMPVYQLYGPIESWNVSGLSNFSWVFDLWYLDEDEEHPFDADLGNWDVSRATTLSGMFYYCHKFQGIGLEKWDVSKVTDFSFMFFENYEFNNKNLSSWNTSDAQNMEQMFSGTSIFDGSGVETWDVSRVESMEGIFSYSDFAGDVSMWNTTAVENMKGMFSNSLFDGDVTNFNTERVTDMAYMFEKTSFDGDVSHFDTSLVLSMGYMFAESPFSGRNGDISGWNVTTCTDMEAMFFSAPNFKQDLSTWNVENVENFDRMFFGAEQFDQSLCTWGPLMIENATVEEMFKFSGCDNTSDPVISIGGPLCEIC